MELVDKVLVVTGAASGIGRALARRGHAAGARGVVLADRAAGGVEAAAAELDASRPGSALAVACDVAVEPDVVALVERAEDRFGPVDVFFANAGIGRGHLIDDSTDDDWRASLDVNVMAHVYAARALVPGWVARGDGYFVATASAAGLLTQIGGAPYAVSKHAAVAFAEWLAVTYGDQGVKVSCLCPMGVNTPMLNPPDADGLAALGSSVVKAAGDVLEPEQVAEAVEAAIRAETFLILPHPQVLTFFQRKANDYDRWLSGMRRLQARVAD